MIKILIKRIIAPEMESTYDVFVKGGLQAAILTPGFLSAEALFDIDNPNVRYIIVKMRSTRDWYSWKNSAIRKESMLPINQVLLEPESITLLKN
jgi:antibiotic biosynthesis monooxygenase (ABM) superfamily enzyme